MRQGLARLGGAPRIALLLAGVYSMGLIAAAFLLPVYRGVEVSTSGALTRGTSTLVDVNGLGVVPVITVPLVITIAVAWALLLRWRGAVTLAWTLTGVLALFNLITLLSIGILILPVTAALIIACSTRRAPA